MQRSARALGMRARQPDTKPNWFRIENAYIPEDSKGEVTPIYIYDEIGDSWFGGTSASDFIQQIAAIKTPKIELHLNSPGGDIFDGVAIYNALRSHPAEVTVVVDALAASAASFIAQAGDKIVMTRAATMMIHDGSGFVWGNAADMRQTADLLDKLSNTVADIYAARAGQSVEFWRNLMIQEVWYNASEAVDAGLADEIGQDTKKEDDEAAQNKWDFSVFNFSGRGAAPNPLQVRQRIANQLKEARVGTRNSTQPQDPDGPDREGELNPESPDVNPDADTTNDGEGNGEPGTVPEPPVPPAAQPTEPENRQLGGFTFTVQGRQTTDFNAVQSRLNMLEDFRNETLRQSRIDFVEGLARDNLILATQTEKLTNYALSLTDEGYDAWKDTWDGVAALPMLSGSHAEGTTNHAGPQSQAVEDVANEIEIKKEIVMQHKRGGMTEDKIMQTPSYRRLMELDPSFKL